VNDVGNNEDGTFISGVKVGIDLSKYEALDYDVK